MRKQVSSGEENEIKSYPQDVEKSHRNHQNGHSNENLRTLGSGDEFGAALVNPSFTLPQPRSAPSSPARSIQKPEAYHEVFRYKVVYPGGTFVRISPAMDAEKTGDILDFGTVFEASKSLFLDGTNYAKLSNGHGWVFDSKNGIEILELLEVVRIPVRTGGSSIDTRDLPTPLPQQPGAMIRGNGIVPGSSSSIDGLRPTSFGSRISSTPSPLTASSMAGRRPISGTVGMGIGGTIIAGVKGEFSSSSSAVPTHHLHSLRQHQQLPPAPPPTDYTRSSSFNNNSNNHNHNNNHHVPSSSSMNSGSVGSQTQQVRAENRIWRDIRARCGQCATFAEFQQLAVQVEALQHPHHPHHYGHGPARPAWGSTHHAAAVNLAGDKKMSHHDLQVGGCIALIASITRQCSAEMADQNSIEACLWALVHMGSRVAHVMALIVDAANNRFEAISSARQGELLRVVLEVGTRTKAHALDLARLVDILPDDIRNFLQRWIIVKSFHIEPVLTGPGAATSPDFYDPAGSDMSYHRNGSGGGDFGSSSDRVGSRGHPTAGGNGSNNNGGLKHRLDRTPISIPRVCSKSVFSCGGGGTDDDDGGHSRNHEKSSSSFLPDCGFGTRIKSDGPPPTEPPYEDETDEHGYVVERKIRNGAAAHGIDDGQNMGGEERGEKKGRGGSAGGTISSAKTSVTKRLVKEIEKQFKRLADPDMQLAGLI